MAGSFNFETGLLLLLSAFVFFIRPKSDWVVLRMGYK